MAMREDNRLIRVALLKAVSRWGDVAHNIGLLEQMSESLLEQDVDVLVTPECFLDGYMERDKQTCTPERLRACSVAGFHDPVIQRVASLAARLSSYIVVGASEIGKDDQVRNTAYLIDRQGGLVGTYYKIQTSLFYEPGNELPVFLTDFGQVGIVICADRRWPENIRCLRLKGAEIILNPTWGDKSSFNTSLMQVRAYENGIPICFAHPEQALICSAEGGIDAVYEANHPGIMVHELDLRLSHEEEQTSAELIDASDTLPFENRRPGLYKAIVDAR